MNARHRRAAAFAALILLFPFARPLRAAPVLGTDPPGQCEADGCSYFDARNRCILSPSGGDRLRMLLDGALVTLKYRDRSVIFRKIPDKALAVGHRFMSYYDAPGAGLHPIRLEILDVVVRPKGACAPGAPGCGVTHYKSKIRIQSATGVLNVNGSGRCVSRPPQPES